MKTILLVEDSPDIAGLYVESLEKNFNIIVAETYQEFLEKIKLNPEIVITDFNFPGGDGNGVARLSRQVGVKKVIIQSDDLSGRIEKNLFDSVFNKTDLIELCKFLIENPSLN